MKRIKSCVWIIPCFLLLTPLAASALEYNTGAKAKIILETDKMSNGEPIDYLDADQPKVTVLRLDLPPGGQTGWHSHPMPVYAYILSGRLTVYIEGGKKVEFKEGDALVEVVNVKHNGVNHGEVPVRLVVFYLGAKDVPNVVRSEGP
mgnify:CR=1 FL=1